MCSLKASESAPFLRRACWQPQLSCALGVAMAGQPIVRDLPPGLQIPVAAQTGPGFDVDQATAAYLGLLSPQQRELSERYFAGGHWLQLLDAMWTAGACVLLLVTGISTRMREWSQHASRRRWISTPDLYSAMPDPPVSA